MLNREEFTAQAAGQVDVVINIINVLLLLSILIAVLGIVNTLALAVLERTRELGMLRAVGLARAPDPPDGDAWRRCWSRCSARCWGSPSAPRSASCSSGPWPPRGSPSWPSRAAGCCCSSSSPRWPGCSPPLLPARRAARLDVLQALAAT